MLQLLLDGGADTEAKNNFGNKPQDLANKRATREVFRKHAEAAAAQAAAVKAAAAKKAAAADERLLVEVDRGPLHHVLRDPTLGPVNVDFQYLSERTLGFAEGERVGRGAFGDVFRGVEPRSGDFFAVKRISALLLSPAALPHAVAAAQRSYDREITALSRFSHPHIVRLIAFSAPPTGERVLVYEFLPRGSLADNLTDDALAAQLTWKARVRVLQQVATALNFLHRGGAGIKCFHRDVKSANICLTATLSAKLIDCGLAMIIEADDERAGHSRVTGTGGGVLGTPGYMSPEYAQTGKYSEKAEAYSFGVVVLEVLTGRLQMADGIDLYAHYRGANSLRVDELDERCGRAQELALELAEGLCALARACLMHFEDERLGLPEVLWQLNEMMAQHCTPTVEEGQLSRAREEIEQLKLAFRLQQLAVAPAPAAEEEPCFDCVVCMDPFPLRGGLRCGGGGGAESHFTCAGCIDGRVRVEAEGALESVRCCGFRCGALYEEQALARHCTPEVYVQYKQAREQYVQAAAEREVVERLAAERLRLAAMPEAEREALRVRTHIVDEILTLKCPRCGKAFVDFEACFALSCEDFAGHGCGSEFCGFCLTLCGNSADAHQHVAQCPFNINEGRDVFGPIENFEEAQRLRRLRLLREYLGPMVAQQRDRALQECERELHHLGLTRNDLFPL
mmetsp:Transcript_34573/g.76257  ORF Transcript_34573/g.76257 Transcript_34573/m.76257 type:complete len:681 (-) Transcript_34573:287-2329(-)